LTPFTFWVNGVPVGATPLILTVGVDRGSADGFNVAGGGLSSDMSKTGRFTPWDSEITNS